MPSKPSRILVTISGSSSAALGQAVDAALQVFRGLDHVLGEFLHRVEPCILDFALGAGAQIGHLGFRAQPFILHFL